MTAVALERKGLSVGSAAGPHAFLGAALLSVTFAAGALRAHVPLRFPVFALVVAIAALSGSRGRSRSPGTGVLISAVFAIGALAISFLFVQRTANSDPANADRLFRYALLFPAAVVAGYRLERAGSLRAFLRWFPALASVTAVAAILERITAHRWMEATSLLGPNLVRAGDVRAIVVSEHPLVLALLLVAALPVVAERYRGGRRLTLWSLITLGVWSTGTRGPLLLLILYTCWVCLPALRMRAPRAFVLGAYGLFSLLGMILVLSSVTASASSGVSIYSTDASDASAQYRAVLYSRLPQVLAGNPLGYGIEGLPPGTLLAATPGGIVDIARSVDSEWVLAALEWGWAGLAALTFLTLRVVRSCTPQRDIQLLMLMGGLFLALHAWVGLGTFFFLTAGSALALRDRDTERGPV